MDEGLADKGASDGNVFLEVLVPVNDLVVFLDLQQLVVLVKQCPVTVFFGKIEHVVHGHLHGHVEHSVANVDLRALQQLRRAIP